MRPEGYAAWLEGQIVDIPLVDLHTIGDDIFLATQADGSAVRVQVDHAATGTHTPGTGDTVLKHA